MGWYSVQQTQAMVSVSVCVVKQHWNTNLAIERFQVQCPVAVVVSLNKKLYTHCSNLPKCLNGDLGKRLPQL